MEQITSKWQSYLNTSTQILYGGNKLIHSKGGILNIYQTMQTLPMGSYPQAELFGSFWSEDEYLFHCICDEIRKCDFQKGSHKYSELLSVTNAVSGMNVLSQTHVVYASKYPITIPFSQRQSNKKGIARFQDLYGDIIMSVGVTINKNKVENRGIFRNPLSIITSKYRNIAMILHAFTCFVVQKFFEDVTFFQVRPMEKMGQILFDSLPKNILTINGQLADIYMGDFQSEHVFQVPISVQWSENLSFETYLPEEHKFSTD